MTRNNESHRVGQFFLLSLELKQELSDKSIELEQKLEQEMKTDKRQHRISTRSRIANSLEPQLN